MNHSAEKVAEQRPAKTAKSSSNWKVRLAVLCVMLLLALVGMGLTQASSKSAWEYWLVVVVIYAGLGLWRSASKAKLEGRKVGALIGRELAHWTTLLAFLGIVLLLENREIISREAASDFSLTMLALTCCLAGIHFDWMLTVVGFVLVVMVLAMATLEQYSIVLWVVVLLIAIAAVAFFYFRARRSRSEDRSIE